jgi:predicted ATPase/serine/threonine protein kinase
MTSEWWQKVEEAYHTARELKEEERCGFLDGACDADATMRRQIEVLLEQDKVPHNILKLPAVELPSGTKATLEEPISHQLPANTLLGPYSIEAPIGEGGMGVVYRARDIRLGRQVAIKVLRHRLAADPAALKRFEQEARSASALNHPNIVTIHDVGSFDANSYIVMEFVEGTSLRRMCSDGPLAITDLLSIAVQIADGLAVAHSRGLVHRDLKPENIMVTGERRAKILDFGLAIYADLPPGSAETRDSMITPAASHPGMILGTVGYMSPQQACGAPTDYRSDQFSFGTILYEMATGHRAFERTTAVETLAAIIREEPEPIGQRNPDIPPPLQWVIKRCLSKNPEDRYASTEDLARELSSIRDQFAGGVHWYHDQAVPDLPRPHNPLIGRNTETSAVKQLLLADDVRLVTLTGPAGTGKTRLAVQVATDLVKHFHGGIHFVPLASVSDPELILPAIFRTLGVRQSGIKPSIDILKKFFREFQGALTLLVLDNFEQLVTTAPVVSELLAVCPAVKVLVTSRAALRLYGEHEFSVPPLSTPDLRHMPEVDTLAQYPAVALFTERAKAAKPDFALTADNVLAVAEICARLDGLPLAIELAAARVKILPPAALAARVQSRLQLLTSGPRDLPKRQQTLRGAIDWSYDLLTAEEQKLFRRLAVFVGGCAMDGAEAVCNARNDLGADLLETMASLVDKSLIQQVEQQKEPRFLMLETIREYALERLTASGEEPQVRRAHAAYCLVLAEEGESSVRLMTGPQQAIWLDRFDIERDNFRYALDWLIQTENAEWGLRLCTALEGFWLNRDQPAEGREYLSAVLKLPGAAPRTHLRARALYAAVQMACLLADFESARALMQESLGIYRELGDKPGILTMLNSQAWLERDRGNHGAARLLFEETLKLFQELGNVEGVARALSNIADVVKLEQDYALASSLYDQSLEFFRQLGDRSGVAWSLSLKGDLAHEQHDFDTARRLYEKALTNFQDLGEISGIARCLLDLGSLARERGDCKTADRYYKESLGGFRELGQKRYIFRVLEGLACCAVSQQLWQRALKLAGAASALRQGLGAHRFALEKGTLDLSLEAARLSLTSEEAAAAWLEGRRMYLEQAIEYAMASDA